MARVALLLAVSWVGPAAAQDAPDDPEVARARAAFAEGMQAAGGGDYAAAADRFREALSIRPSPAVSFNLAQALAELGSEPEAWVLCDDIVADEAAPQTVRDAAEQLREQLQARVGRLRITVGGGEALSARLDGVDLPADRIGRETAVTPGPHTVESVRDGETISTRQLDLPAGAVALVDLSVVATENVRVVEVPAEPEDVEVGSGSSTVLYLGIGGAVLLAGVVVLAVVFLSSGGTEDPVEGNLPPGVLTWD